MEGHGTEPQDEGRIAIRREGVAVVMSFILAVMVLVVGVLSGCAPLPEAYSSAPSPRPVEPLPFEKKGYTIAYPSPTIAPLTSNGAPIRKVITAKPGTKLSDVDIAVLLEQAEDKAVSAANLSQSAQSKDDWTLAISQWRKAIALLKPIAAQKPLVRQKLSEYQRNLADAQARSTTNPRQIVTGGESGGYGVPLVDTSGDKPSTPGASPAPSTPSTPGASPAPGASPGAGGEKQ